MPITKTETRTVPPGEYAIRAVGTTGAATATIEFHEQAGSAVAIPTDIEIWSLPACNVTFTLSGDYTVAFLRHYE